MTAAIAKGRAPAANVVKPAKHRRRRPKKAPPKAPAANVVKTAKHRQRRPKKTPPKFLRYSGDVRRKIEAEVKRSCRRPVDMVGLLDQLERFGRNYASMSMDPDLLKLFVHEERRIAQFRTEEDRLPLDWRIPPALRQYVAEIERFCQERTFQLGTAYTLRILGLKEKGPIYTRARSVSSRMPRLTISSRPPPTPPPTRSPHTLAEAKSPRNQNARLARFDSYCVLLLGLWMSIGGEWWSKFGSTKAGGPAAFISVCTEPVAGKTSTTVGAIRKRLYRLVKCGAIVAEAGSADAAKRRWAEFGQDGNNKPGKTKPD